MRADFVTIVLKELLEAPYPLIVYLSTLSTQSQFNSGLIPLTLKAKKGYSVKRRPAIFVPHTQKEVMG